MSSPSSITEYSYHVAHRAPTCPFPLVDSHHIPSLSSRLSEAVIKVQMKKIEIPNGVMQRAADELNRQRPKTGLVRFDHSRSGPTRLLFAIIPSFRWHMGPLPDGFFPRPFPWQEIDPFSPWSFRRESTAGREGSNIGRDRDEERSPKQKKRFPTRVSGEKGIPHPEG